MPWRRDSLKTINDRIASDFDGRLPGAEARLPVSVAGVQSRVHAGVAHGIYGHQDRIAAQILPDTADPDFLVRHASIYGVRPRGAAVATGTVTLTATLSGVYVKAGAKLRRADGATFVTTAPATITGGSAQVAVAAELAGAGGNTEAGIGLSMLSPVEGVASTATVVSLTGGAEAESAESLLARLLDRIQAPPHGGADHDYMRWASEVEGVGKVFKPGRNEMGRGTVTVRFVTTDGAIPDAELVAAVAARIEESPDPDRPEDCRPTTADVYVVAPVPWPVAIEITGLDPDTPAVRAAIEAELADLFFRSAEPGAPMLISHIRETVSTAAGEVDHEMVAPVANAVPPTVGHIPVFEGVTWS